MWALRSTWQTQYSLIEHLLWFLYKMVSKICWEWLCDLCIHVYSTSSTGKLDKAKQRTVFIQYWEALEFICIKPWIVLGLWQKSLRSPWISKLYITQSIWCLKRLSVLMLCVPVFIFTSGSSVLLGCPCCGYWSECRYLPCSIHFSVNFFMRKQTKHENTQESAIFVLTFCYWACKA